MTVAQERTLFTAPPPISLYIHFPWCVAKCPYCDFNSHVLRNDLPQDAYLEKILQDLQQSCDLYEQALAGREIQSIFMGGGTPSLFSGEALGGLLTSIQSHLTFAKDIEITMEANPGTLEHARFEDYLSAGINRLSVGVQSFENEMLKKLGRVHNDNEARIAIEKAKVAGFENINIDMMYGLPDQDIKQALTDLEKAIACGTPHLSWYQLTLEPNTAFFKKPPSLPNDDNCFDMYQFGQEKCREAGFENYEVSAYAKAEHQCRHNKIYWEYGDYLGVGAGAHSKITNIHEGIITRNMKTKHPKKYLSAENDFIQNSQQVSPLASSFEFMLNVLRLNQAIPLSLFNERTGLSTTMIESPLNTAIAQGMLVNQDGVLRKTDLGERFVDEIVQLFLHH